MAIFAYGLLALWSLRSTNLGEIAHALSLRALPIQDPIVILALLTT